MTYGIERSEKRSQGSGFRLLRSPWNEPTDILLIVLIDVHTRTVSWSAVGDEYEHIVLTVMEHLLN